MRRHATHDRFEGRIARGPGRPGVPLGRLAAVLAVATALVTVTACSSGSPSNTGAGAPTPAAAASVTDDPSPYDIGNDPSPADSNAPSDGTPTKSKSKHSAPPPDPTIPPPPPCKTKIGKAISKKQVRADLTKASKINEYAHLDPLTLDSRLGGKTPHILIPLRMLKAVAANESGWQSNCQSNDGLGFGTMQVAPGVVSDVNTKFQRSYSSSNPLQNIEIGNAYLEYLTAHFGIIYFHNNFDLTKNTKLRDAVLAAYNVGLGEVDRGGQIQIGPIGRQYAVTVVALMSPDAPCQKTWGK